MAAERIGLELVDLIFSLDLMPNRGALNAESPLLALDRSPASPRHLSDKRGHNPGRDRSGMGQAPEPEQIAVAVE